MSKQPSAHVIVLGDLGRSPRILSQARYLAQHGWNVTISGYVHKSDNIESSSLHIKSLTPCPNFKNFIHPSLLAHLLKFLFTAFLLFIHLIRHCRSQLVLLQNPPAVPTFQVIWLFVRMTGKSFVIDWHNYGYTLMSLASSQTSLSTKLYRSMELGFASRFLTGTSPKSRIGHLCVSKALQEDLMKHGIRASVYYDRPSDVFKPTDVAMAHKLFMKLSQSYPELSDPDGSCLRTRLTEVRILPNSKPNQNISWRPDRPALVVSSCSWTDDDDFSIMLNALDQYDHQVELEDFKLPDLLFAVTGKGPLKDYYAQQTAKRNWQHVQVIMPWLDWDDYPTFIGSADLGISLHRSSSGLDLPMKVVDLLGVQVPVLALTYPTLYELIPSNQPVGLHFTNPNELAIQLISLLNQTNSVGKSTKPTLMGSPELIRFRKNLHKWNTEQIQKGFDYWKSTALPVLEAVLEPGSDRLKVA